MNRYVYTCLLIASALFSNSSQANLDELIWDGVPHTMEIPKEQLTHECGVAFVRLRKPVPYYAKQYHDASWGLKKLLTLMEKQRHRGQDGAGIASVKFDMPPGQEYSHRLRFASKNALDNLFELTTQDVQGVNAGIAKDPISWKTNSNYLGEVMLGHVRYATHSGLDIRFCQPFVRSHSVASRNITFAGNFNMTNTKDLLEQLQEWGLSPVSESDTQIVLESFTYQLDQEYEAMAQKTQLSGRKAVESIAQNIDLLSVLRKAAAHWDGGYVFCGMLGNGDSFCCRDPAGIRPGFAYINDDVFAVASERVALMDSFDADSKEIVELKPGHAVLIKRSGEITEARFTDALTERQCAFERIYFSKASDPQIYQERKALGRNLAQRVYDEIGGDLEHTVFSYVPNSSLPAFQGLVDEIANISGKNTFRLLEKNIEKNSNGSDLGHIEQLMQKNVRSEALVAKNQKMRTFISSDQERVELGIRLYEVTQGVVKPQDTLVIVDDSLVRGTTFRDLLMIKLTSLNPKRIILVISAPPVMYPDCYGIDMSQLGKFVAFQAAVDIIKEQKQKAVIQQVRALSLQQDKLPAKQLKNAVQKIYSGISHNQLSAKIAQLITPSNMKWKGELKVIFQTIDGFHQAMPNFKGDWYFTGEYPTNGGYKVLNTAYLNWFDGLGTRAY